MPSSKEIHLKSRPRGLPTADNFEFVEVDVSEPGENEVLVQNIYMSVDPYMRGRMREDFALGEVLAGGAVGKVVASKHNDFQAGDYVSNFSGWREYFLSNGEDLTKVDASLAPLSCYLGVLGMPGLTAYGGLLVTGELKDGETVFVSAASGAVGSVVGQIAKVKGCTVIGSAGSDEKVAELINEFGYGWPYSSLDVYRNGEFDQSVEMTIGYSQITQINSYENDSFDFTVNTQLMYPEELGGYKIQSESGTTLVDEDNVNEAPESSYNILVCESEDNVSISEIKSEELTLVKMVDVLGRKQQEHKKGSILFYIYDNGKVEKKFNP